MAAQSASWAAISDEWRSQWRVGLAAFLAIGTSFGALNALSSLFVLPLQEAFGWSRGEIALAHNAALLSALCSPFLGRLIDRLGTRRIMIVGMAISAMVYLGMAAMTGSLALFYVLMCLGSVIGLTASGLTCSRVISEHFVRSRGFSLAVARSGLAMAGAALPAVMYAVIARYGWRGAYVVEALLVLVIALPCVYLWVRDAAPGHRPAAASPLLPGWRTLLSDRRVLFLCIGAGLGYAPANAIMTQLQPLLISKGLGLQQSAHLVGLVGMASLGGAIVTGLLVDRFWAPAVATVFAVGSAVGSATLAMSGVLDPWMAIGAILLIGLGLGAEIDVVAFMVARYFGVSSFSTVYGLSILSVAVSGAVGAALLGWSFDRYGNYDLAMAVVATSFVMSGVFYLGLGRYPEGNSQKMGEAGD